jgi:hypothetical protein
VTEICFELAHNDNQSETFFGEKSNRQNLRRTCAIRLTVVRRPLGEVAKV